MILHVDMDAFYASIEERDDPSLRGKPVVVGGPPERRGVVAAANYRARSFGVRSAMPSAIAKRLCPDAIFLPSRIRYYAEVSRSIHEVFDRFSPTIEPLALDEAFLDMRGSQRLFGSVEAAAHQLKAAVADEVGLVASVGLAENKFLAKLASDLEKPDGFVVLGRSDFQARLDPLSVSRLWGVGPRSAQVLQRAGLETIGDVRNATFVALSGLLGEGTATHVSKLALGIDERAVMPDRDAKTVSHETTFAEDIEDSQTLKTWIAHLSEQVAWRLRKAGLEGRTVQLKVRFSDFKTLTRRKTLEVPTNSGRSIRDIASQLLGQLLEQRRKRAQSDSTIDPVRLVGVGISGLRHAGAIVETEAPAQADLFELPAQGDEPHGARDSVDRRVDDVLDAARQRFGIDAIRRGRPV